MSATPPAPIARQTPTGLKLPNGFKSLICFSRLPAANFWEKEIKPAGIDGGEAIHITTMHNTAYHTKAARKLAMIEDVSIKAAYDPNFWDQIINTLLNQNGNITEIYPDGSTLAYYGYLRKADKGPLKEGEFPEIDMTIVITNVDPVSGLEAGPVSTSVAGT